MKGLLLKDFSALKGFAKILGLLLVLFAVQGVVTGDAGFIGSLMMVFCAMLPMTSVALDDQAGWNAYAQCMPVSRREQVVSKYLIGLIFAAVMCVIIVLVMLASSAFHPVNWGSILAMTGFSLCVALLLSSLLLPPTIKFGVEKARLLTMIAAMAATSGFTVLRDRTVGVDLSGALSVLPYALPVVTAIVFVASLMISIRIFEAKEF